MKPYLHAKISAQKWGGKAEDYQPIHDFIDSSKEHHADVRHRALLHNSWGCFLVERLFGVTARNNSGREYSPRDVAEQHILDDLGRIPAVTDYLQHMALAPWFGGPVKRNAQAKHFNLED